MAMRIPANPSPTTTMTTPASTTTTPTTRTSITPNTTPATRTSAAKPPRRASTTPLTTPLATTGALAETPPALSTTVATTIRALTIPVPASTAAATTTPSSPSARCVRLGRLLRRRLQSQLRLHHLQVLPRLALLPRISQQKCRIVGHPLLRSTRRVPTPTQRTQWLPHAQQVRRRSRPQRANPLRPLYINLLQQKL